MTWRLVGGLVAIIVVASACNGTAEEATTSTTASSDTTSSTTSTTAAPGADTTSTTTTAGDAASTTTTEPVVGCPEDLAFPDSGSAETGGWAVAAYEARAGDELWSVEVGGRPIAGIVVVDATAAIVFTDGTAVGVDTRTCAQEWRVSVPGELSNVVLNRNVVYVVGPEVAAAINALNGGVRWNVPWAGGRVAAPTSISASDERLFITDAGAETLTILDAEGGVVSDEVVGAGASGIDVAGEAYAFAAGGNVTLNSTLAGPIWSASFDGEVAGSPTIFNELVLVAGGNEVVAFQFDDGLEVWRATLETEQPEDTVVTAPLVDHDEVHVMTQDGRMHHLALSDGQLVATTSYARFQFTPEFDDRIITVTEGGMTTGINTLNQQRWTVSSGADMLSRFTETTVTAGVVLIATFDAERF